MAAWLSDMGWYDVTYVPRMAYLSIQQTASLQTVCFLSSRFKTYSRLTSFELYISICRLTPLGGTLR
jgi:hypothetical protein